MNPNPTSALRRAALLLRLSDSDGPPPDVAETGDTLVCPATGRTVVVCDGIVDLLGKEFAPSLGQRMLDTASSAWLYDWIRPHFGPLIGMPSFASEVQNVAERLGLERGATVLDIACGHGNFTLELARRSNGSPSISTRRCSKRMNGSSSWERPALWAAAGCRSQRCKEPT